LDIGSNAVTKFRVRDGAALSTFSVLHGPTNVPLDGAHMWVANTGSNSVSKL
jgi:hypothetical protein